MQKPIIVIHVPAKIAEADPNDLMKIRTVATQTTDNEYFVFVVKGKDKHEFKFEVFYDKDFEETSYNELRKLLEAGMR